MKPKSHPVLMTVFVVGALALATSLSLSQSFHIDWAAIGGGGGKSSGGGYSVEGAIVQSDAGPMTGGEFTLSDGFVGALVAVQETGAPFLSIQAGEAGSATISWSPDTPGLVLQYTDNLGSANWSDAVSGSSNPVTIQTVPSIRYFRLHKP